MTGVWMPCRNWRTRAAHPDLRSTFPLLRLAAASGVCAVLAGCSAHERANTQAAAPTPPTVVTAQAGEAASQPAGAQPTTTVAAIPTPTARPAIQLATSGALPARTPVSVGSAQAPVAARIGKSGGGLASWYGDRFHGRLTANGERFDMHAFSAAHRSFPLPSYVRVTNVSNGRSMVVRVNDRGPFHGDRVIDVSRRTADILGFRGNGVGTVKLDLIGRAPSGGSDDRRLLASYQELGRPTVPPGMQVAALGPVSDADLAAEGQGGAFAVASAAVSRSATYAVGAAYKVAETAKSAASSARDAVRRIVPAAQPKPVAVAAAEPGASAPTATAYATDPAPIASVPAVIAGQSPVKRVVTASEPVLASATPAPAAQKVDVSSRIAASFEGFR